MNVPFYIAAGVAVFSTVMLITRYNMIHALLYLVLSFLAISVIFYMFGAPFIAALEIIIYAGAIVVLIIFVIMMLNLKDEAIEQERRWLTPRILILPSILVGGLLSGACEGPNRFAGPGRVDAREGRSRRPSRRG